MNEVKVSNSFLRSLTLRRYSSGSYVDGKWVDGAYVDSEIQASAQPLTAGEYRLLPEGNSGLMGWKVFWNEDFQFGIDGSLKPDEMLIDGKWFKLIYSEPWSAYGHSEAMFIEIK